MHIPNGYLSDPVCAATTVMAAASVSIGVWQARRLLGQNHCGQLAAVSAGVFAAQMLNVPVDHGTSGHLIGAALASAILGPWRAMLAMSTVLLIQATVFGDGGLFALGANVLNMAVIAPWTAWGVYRLTIRSTDSARGTACAFGLAAFASVFAAALACSFELALSGTVPIGEVLPAMLRAHSYIAIGEGFVTVVATLALFDKTQLAGGSQQIRAWRAEWSWVTFGASAAVAILLAPWASSLPDGLERVAQNLQFESLALPGFAGLAPDYTMPGIGSLPLALALGGLFGVMVVVIAGYCAGHAATLRFSKQPK